MSAFWSPTQQPTHGEQPERMIGSSVLFQNGIGSHVLYLGSRSEGSRQSSIVSQHPIEWDVIFVLKTALKEKPQCPNSVCETIFFNISP